MEWAIEHVKTYGKPVAATICIGPNGDMDGVPLGECAVRMAKAGADLVGLNCLFDPFIMLDCMKVMKEALDKEGLKPHLMSQPLGYRDPDAGHFGWINLPEFPYAIEPRYLRLDCFYVIFFSIKNYASNVFFCYFLGFISDCLYFFLI